ncbi:MAG: ferritin [Clostridiales bacterium]|nr:ferritin [Clostridiales bacterium]
MMRQAMSNALKEQVRTELSASSRYMTVSAYCRSRAYPGFAHWMDIHARQELSHGKYILHYLLEQNGFPQYRLVQTAPDTYADWPDVFDYSKRFPGLLEPDAEASLSNLFTLMLEHEHYVTLQLKNLTTLAVEEGDQAAYHFLQAYIEEQMAEETAAGQLLHNVSRAGDNYAALYALDRELSRRTFTEPFTDEQADARRHA